jgi:hypothetical protein
MIPHKQTPGQSRGFKTLLAASMRAAMEEEINRTKDVLREIMGARAEARRLAARPDCSISARRG